MSKVGFIFILFEVIVIVFSYLLIQVEPADSLKTDEVKKSVDLIEIKKRLKWVR